MPWYDKYLHNVWNIPNILTIARLLSVPVYVILYYNGYIIASLCVFILASLTDLMDGYIARKYNLITAFGKLMDPLADKVMVLTVMLTRVVSGRIPLFAFCVVMGKELFMIWGGWALVKRKDIVVYASPIGKIAQFIFCAGLALSFFDTAYSKLGFDPDLILIYTAVALTFAALIHYTSSALKQVKNRKTE